MDCGGVLAAALKRWNVTRVFGVVGIPVTPLAFALQKADIEFIGTRTENSAGFAAAADALLYGRTGVVLLTGGPGLINGLSGLAHATVNRLPLVTIAGGPAISDMDTGCFQDFNAVKQLPEGQVCKRILQTDSLENLPLAVQSAFESAWAPPFGGALLVVPACVIRCPNLAAPPPSLQACLYTAPKWPAPSDQTLCELRELLSNAKRPLVIIGKGVHFAKAGSLVRQFVEKHNLPFLSTPQGKGAIPENHSLCVSAARSSALNSTDFCIILAARLNWILHHGRPPRWAEDAKIAVVDLAPSFDLKSSGERVLSVTGDVKSVLQTLMDDAAAAAAAATEAEIRHAEWLERLQDTVRERSKPCSAASSSEEGTTLMTFASGMQVISQTIEKLRRKNSDKKVILVAEGSKTLDVSRRAIASVDRRIDCGTWGTMGMGLPSVLAAALDPDSLVCAVIGDSAVGFSLAELETLVRYRCKSAIIFLFNNGGIYGGPETPQWPPLPTELSLETRYDLVMSAMGGVGFIARNRLELEQIAEKLTRRDGAEETGPILVNLLIQPTDLGSDLANSAFAREH